MIKKRLSSLAFISLFVMLWGCQAGVIIRGGNALAKKQACQDTSVSGTIYETPGITRFDITVGQSTKQDVLALFGEPDDIINRIDTVPMKGICWMIYKNGPEFWISNERVVAMNLSNFGFRSAPGIVVPQTIQELYTLYGKPDFVVWHGPYHVSGSRYAVWSTKGVMANLIVGTHHVSSVVYFSPMSQAEYLASNLSQFINFEKRPHPFSDVIDGDPQDPFIWGE